MPSLLTVTSLPVFDVPDTPAALIDGPTCQMPAIDFIAAPVPETLPTPPKGIERPDLAPTPFVSAPVAEIGVARCTCGDAVLDHDAEGCHVAGCRCLRNPAARPVAGRHRAVPELPSLPPLVTPWTWVLIVIFGWTGWATIVLALTPGVRNG